MAVTYHIDTTGRVVHLTTTGTSSFGEWREALLAVFADPAYHTGFNFLSDRREESDVPTPEFARDAAAFLGHHAVMLGHVRWAAVSRRLAVYGMQRIFSAYAEMGGVTAAAFTDYGQARRWLLAQPNVQGTQPLCQNTPSRDDSSAVPLNAAAAQAVGTPERGMTSKQLAVG